MTNIGEFGDNFQCDVKYFFVYKSRRAHLRVATQLNAPRWELKGIKASEWRFLTYLHNQLTGAVVEVQELDCRKTVAKNTGGLQKVLRSHNCKLESNKRGYRQRVV